MLLFIAPLLFYESKELDKTAFISITPASNVYGEGFEEIKTGLNLSKKNKK